MSDQIRPEKMFRIPDNIFTTDPNTCFVQNLKRERDRDTDRQTERKRESGGERKGRQTDRRRHIERKRQRQKASD